MCPEVCAVPFCYTLYNWQQTCGRVVLKYSTTIVFTCPLYLDVKYQVLSGKIIMWWYYRFLYTSSSVGQLLDHPPSRKVTYPKDKSCPDLYPLIRPPRRPLTFCRGRILNLEFIWFPPTIAVYSVAHSLPLWGVGRDFPFTEVLTRSHFSYLSGNFRYLNIQHTTEIWTRISTNYQISFFMEMRSENWLVF